MTSSVSERNPELLERLSADLADIVFETQKEAFVEEEGDLLHSDALKIQHLVLEIERFYCSTEARYFPAYRFFKVGSDQFSPIQYLVKAAITAKEAASVKRKALYALVLIGKQDPHVDSINYELQRLISKRGSFQEKDQILNRLQNYVRTVISPLTISFPIRPFRIQKVEATLLTGPHTSGFSKKHDLFWTLLSVAVSTEDNLLFDNLCDIAEHEGMDVGRIARETEIDWVRDPMLLRPQGGVLLPSRFHWTEDLSTIVARLTEAFDTHFMGAAARQELTERLLQEKPLTQREVLFYFEGGNLILAMNGKEEIFYLSGSHNLLYSFLNSAFTFAGREEELLKYLENLEATPVLEKERVEAVRRKLAKAGFLAGHDEKAQIWLAKLSLAAIEYIKDIMKEELDFPVLNLGDPFEAQPNFHLDIFLAPGPEGKVFLQNHALCILILEGLLKQYKLPPAHIQRLLSYLEQAKKCQIEVGEKLEAIAKKLHEYGFKVVPIPGLFFHEKNKMAINFINSLIGKREDGYFCITNGSSHPVDKLLQGIVAAFFRGENITRVYFAGRHSQGEIAATGRLEYTPIDRSLDQNGGLHCRTQEKNAYFSTLKKSLNGKKGFLDIPTPQAGIKKTLPAFFAKMLALAARLNKSGSVEYKTMSLSLS